MDKTENDNSQQQYIFISLNLFILIFFIALISYSRTTETNHNKNVNDILYSFRKADTYTTPVIIYTAEDLLYKNAREYYINLLGDIVPEQYHLNTNNEPNIIIYKFGFNFKDIMQKETNDITNKARDLIHRLVKSQTELQNYHMHISLEIIVQEDINYLKKISAMIMNFLDQNMDNQLINYNLTPNKQSYDIIAKVSLINILDQK
jgi:hypothetical protein